MPQPPKYARTRDFTQQEAHKTDHAGINAELDNVGATLEPLRQRQALLLNDQDQLRGGLIKSQHLDEEIVDGLVVRVAASIADNVAAAQTAKQDAIAAASVAMAQTAELAAITAQTTNARDAAALAASEAQAARDAMQVGSGNLLPNAALSPTIKESNGYYMPDGWANDRYFPTSGTWAAASYRNDYKPEGVEYIAVYRPGGSTDQAYLRCNRFSVVGGNWYEGSAHAVGDNCTWHLRLHFFGAAGDYVGTGTVGTAAKGAGYLSKNLSTWQRLFGVVQAPASATSAVLSMEMPRPPAAVPYEMMFMARPYVGVAGGPSQALPSPWSPSGPGPQTATHLIAEDPHPQYLGKHIAVAGGTADALHITFDRAPASWDNLHGTPIWIKASAANTSTSPTLSVTGLPGAKTLVKGANAALAVGDVAGAGHWLCVQYNKASGVAVLLNAATRVQLATAAEVATGIDALKAVTPATLLSSKGAAKAWVNINGTTGAIRASFNVSSVTRNGVGDYTITFTKAMSDANYTLGGSATIYMAMPCLILCPAANAGGLLLKTTSAIRIYIWDNTSDALYDANEINAIILGN